MTPNQTRTSPLKWFILILIYLIYLGFNFSPFYTKGGADADFMQNMAPAFNLAKYGYFSQTPITTSPKADFATPFIKREPLIPFIWAGILKVQFNLNAHTLDDFDVFHPTPYLYFFTDTLRIIAIGLAVMGLFSLLWISWQIRSSFWFSASIGGLYVLFLPEYWAGYWGGLLLMWHAYFLWRWVRTPQSIYAAVFSFFWALLCLTKAMFWYWGILVFILTLTLSLLKPKTSLPLIVGLSVGALVIAPWLLRNYYWTDRFFISIRGAEVLNIRAHFDTMTWPEYQWGIQYIRQTLLGKQPAISDPDEVERLNRIYVRGKDNNLYTISKAENKAFLSEFKAHTALPVPTETPPDNQTRQALGKHYAKTAYEADEALKQKALAQIKTHWKMHLALTPYFLQNGLIQDTIPVGFYSHKRFFFAFFEGLLALSLVGFCSLLSHKNRTFWAFILPALFGLLFLATWTHFIPRYREALMPLLLFLPVLGADYLRLTVLSLFFKKQNEPITKTSISVSMKH